MSDAIRNVRSKMLSRLRGSVDAARERRLLKSSNLGNQKRIYHVHVRKSGGTSLNHMFLSLGGEDGRAVYNRMPDAGGHTTRSGPFLFVGWNTHSICKGRFHYAFSHHPFHSIQLPPDTFTFTCLRDPVKRIISHYNMLMSYRDEGVDHPCMTTEESWLGRNFGDFLDRIPRESLENQLYMFSQSFDPQQAAEAIGQLSHVMWTENFAEGVQGLNHKTNLHLTPLHRRAASRQYPVTSAERQQLEERLHTEQTFLSLTRQIKEM